MLYEMIVNAGPVPDTHFFLEVIGGEVRRFFTPTGEEIVEPVQDWALAYSCFDPSPPVPVWYVPLEG